MAQLARALATLMERKDRLGALTLLKTEAPTLKLGQRQRIVNECAKAQRERGSVDEAALARSLADLMDGVEGIQLGASGAGAAGPSDTLGQPSSAASGGPASSSDESRRPWTVRLYGDSHANTFTSVESDEYRFLAHPFTGSSAMGLRHVDSISSARTALERDLRSLGDCELVAFKFGQVDADFVYYLKLARQPELSFADFAADSVHKYGDFLRHVLDTLLADVARERIVLLTNFPTVVADEHLRASLCTLPHMRPDFKLAFKEQLARMDLPNQRQRTAYGRLYADALAAQANALGVRCVDVFDCLLDDRRELCRVTNPNDNHHLVPSVHVPLLAPALDAAFGRPAADRHRAPAHFAHRRPAVVPAELASGSGGGGNATDDPRAALRWLTFFEELKKPHMALTLRGHTTSTYARLVRTLGAPFRTSIEGVDGPDVATWLVDLTPSAPTAEGGEKAPSPLVAFVRGRYNSWDPRDYAWIVEANADRAVELLAAALAGQSCTLATPPAMFRR